MLTDVRPWAASEVSRRSVLVLATGGVLALAGCSFGTDSEPTSAPSEDADARLAEAVAVQEVGLIALYDATISAYPALASALSPLRDEHVAHRDALAQPSGSPSGLPTIATSEATALAAILDAERRAVAERSEACASALGAESARLYALIAASEAGHVEFLRQRST